MKHFLLFLLYQCKNMVLATSIVGMIVFATVGCTKEKSAELYQYEAASNNPWWKSARQTLKERLAVVPNNNRAKNVILFIGDGMGISTITAARIFDGQSRGDSGEENILSFEQFPHVALVKTYNTDAQVPDSAGTASAINTGVRSRFLSVSIWPDQLADDCFGPQTNFPKTLGEISEAKGMSTGIVTTDKITYATPAAVFAHVPHRSWEDDSGLPLAARKRGCQDIAQQLVGFPYGDGLDVVLAGGTESLLPVSQGGKRLDGQNLIELWRQRHPQGNFVATAKDLRKIDTKNSSDQLLGLFAPHHLAYAADKDTELQPTLVEMTSVAIDVLSKNDKGYFLMVENGNIDHAHHQTNAYRALSDTQVLAQAVEAALDKVDLNDTLVLVTADHSHPFTITGYPKRGNPILGFNRPAGSKGQAEVIDGYAIGIDEEPYTTLGYRIGPNARNYSANVAKVKETDKDYLQQTAVPLATGFHGGEDVALFAIGPQSHLVGGVIEQNVIFHLIAHSLGWDSD